MSQLISHIPPASRAGAYVRLMRPGQWVKNVFVLLPAFLNGDILNTTILWHTVVAFILFSLTSSAVYAINDSVDAPFDASNPEKCHRPVASGLISRKDALWFAALVLVAVGLLLMLIPARPIRQLWLPLTVYLAVNLCYSFGLKKIPVVDILAVAGCFLIRVWAGGVAGPVRLTLWTLVLVLMLTLFMATGKRRHEAWLCATMGVEGRSNIRYYSLKMLDWAMIGLGAGAVGLYLIWCLSDSAYFHFHAPYLWITTLFALMGIARYLYITLRLNRGGSPTKMLLHDRVIMLAVILWIATFAAIIHY